ncbi:MAG: hypothetical protein J1E40_10135 [Oscillospiraceae bacterium]|nr:hypothetical protein [Oscillospiraceae bacterium]
MKEWKSTEWQDKLKRKPVRYWIRDEWTDFLQKLQSLIPQTTDVKFDWVIAYCTDGECAVMYWK